MASHRPIEHDDVVAGAALAMSRAGVYELAPSRHRVGSPVSPPVLVAEREGALGERTREVGLVPA